MVVNTDVNIMAVLQYAVNYLHTPHILVVGHYDCGGVKAAMTNQDHISPLENWLRNIRDVYRLHQEEVGSERERAQQRGQERRQGREGAGAVYWHTCTSLRSCC